MLNTQFLLSGWMGGGKAGEAPIYQQRLLSQIAGLGLLDSKWCVSTEFLSVSLQWRSSVGFPFHVCFTVALSHCKRC